MSEVANISMKSSTDTRRRALNYPSETCALERADFCEKGALVRVLSETGNRGDRKEGRRRRRRMVRDGKNERGLGEQRVIRVRKDARMWEME